MKILSSKSYTIHSEKLSDKVFRAAILSDLHGKEIGKQNIELIQKLRQEKPDIILCIGDMLSRNDYPSFDIAKRLFLALAKDFPVYYALGNHEYKHYVSEDPAYLKYEFALKQAGIHILHNEKAYFFHEGKKVCIYGLDLPLKYYKKPFSPKLEPRVIEKLIGKPDKDCFNILMAHNPKYGDTYFKWNADLTLAGHYHGGVIRFSENMGLISPQLHIFPKYCCGIFEKGKQHMIVSSGLGEHSALYRIHNPREMIMLTMES